MKYVWLVINIETKDVVAVYDTKAIAEKLAPELSKKVKAMVSVQKRTVNLELNQIGTRP